MDSALKEFTKLQKVSVFGPSESPGSKPNSHSITDSLDSLLNVLYGLKQHLENGTASQEDIRVIPNIVDEKKKEIEEKQKEQHACMIRYGKALDKAFNSPLPTNPPMFQSEASIRALDRHVALHFMRNGQFSMAEEFLTGSTAIISDDLKANLLHLHAIITALRAQNIQPAMEWCNQNAEFLRRRSSPLEFRLHRSQFIRLLLSSDPPNALSALSYAQKCFPPLYVNYSFDIRRLIASLAFLPSSRLMKSPYADLASPDVHIELEPLFSQEYCASLGLTRQLPLHVLADIGGGSALARIEKAKKVMRERKNEWSQGDSSLIEIPLPSEYRYHSVFTCPVSKEQATEANPPMMLTCGHVVAKESLQKLNKPQGRVKCPYCPLESQPGSALQVHF